MVGTYDAGTETLFSVLSLVGTVGAAVGLGSAVSKMECLVNYPRAASAW